MQVREAQRVPDMMDAKRPTSIHIIIKVPKVKYKERILKAAREKQRVTFKGIPIRLSVNFSKKTFASKKGLARSIQSHGKTYNLDYFIQQSYHLEWKGRYSASQTR